MGFSSKVYFKERTQANGVSVLSAPPEPREAQMRVLFVDDEPCILRAYERQFRKRFRVCTAESAEEGLAAIDRDCFEVIVSDMRMPGMNGLEFLAKARERSPDSSQILLTGDPITFTGAEHPAYFRCLEKPCARANLLAALEEAIAAHHRSAATRRGPKESETASETAIERFSPSVPGRLP